jgi:transcriptional regulator with XRE-family HTH domain
MEPPIVAAPVEYDSFGALLRSQRQRAHLSQEELAARSGLSERSIRNLEANRVRVPRASTARLLADALGQAGPEREAFVRACRGDPDPPERVETRSAPGADPARLQGDLPAQLPMDMHGVAGREDQLARRRDRTVLPRAPPRSNGGGPQRPCAVAGLVHRRAPRVACHHRAGRRRFRPPHLAAGVGFDRLSPATWALAGLGRHPARRPGRRAAAGRPCRQTPWHAPLSTSATNLAGFMSELLRTAEAAWSLAGVSSWPRRFGGDNVRADRGARGSR